MIYRYTSVKRVVAKVLTDLDVKEGSNRITDMISWAGEALEKIGAFPSLKIKITGRKGEPSVVLSNYQAKLPCDLHKMIQVAYSSQEGGPYYPMRYGTGSFDTHIPIGETSTSSDGTTTSPDSAIITLAMSLYNLTYALALAKINAEPGTRSVLSALLTGSKDTIGPTGTYNYTYVITPGYIKTNTESGYLLLSYQAIPTDKDGYPLIPDDQSFMEALYWYITMKLLYPEWKEGRVRDAVYYDARRSWNYYSKQAYGNALMPNPDQLESIKNTWLKLVPELGDHARFYSTTGEEQRIYNANK